MRRYYIFMASLVGFSVAVIILSVVSRSGPAHDTTIVNDLGSISSSIENYSYTNEALPANLSDLSDLDATVKSRLASYQYVATSSNAYHLCATFKTDQSSGGVAVPALIGGSDPAIHRTGYQCFSYTVVNIKPSPVPTPLSSPVPVGSASGSSGSASPTTVNKLCSTVAPTSSTYLSPRTITAIDQTAHKITLTTQNVTVYLYWGPNVPISYDAGCKMIAFSSLQAGQTIQGYYGSSNLASVIQLQ